ncbi:MAG: DUF5925 domain-containing protein [Pseudonocardiaceae bacterium]
MTSTHPELARSLVFAGNTPVEGALSALALEPFVTGRQPYSHAIELHDVDAASPLLPPGAAAALTHNESGLRSHLSCGPGWTLFAMRSRGRSAVIRVCAETDALAREVLELATATAIAAVSDDPAASIGFWHADPTRTGGIRAPRSVDVPDWLSIRRNYAADTAAALDRLMTLEPGDVTGRLILLHGPAGTGKTTALRALAHSWRQWCQVECVLDPDVLFADSSYLMSVALGDSRPDTSLRWRLLVLEDCDELVRAEAKRGTGQALSRLLNLTDGLLGQGLDVLVCLTTNEDVARLHPAVVRPGRCLAEIEVGPLPPEQARRWLNDPHVAVNDDGAILAELYRLRGQVSKVEHSTRAALVGNYL